MFDEKREMVKRWSRVSNSRGKRVWRKTWGKPGPPPVANSNNMVAFYAKDQRLLHEAAGVENRAQWDRLSIDKQAEAHQRAKGDFSVVDGYRHKCRG